jgi:universal stress protein E
MMRYSNILAFVDPEGGSLDAVRAALTLAKEAAGTVTAARVIDIAPDTPSAWGPEGWDVFRAEVLGHELSTLSTSLERISEGRASLTGKVVLGKPSFELVQLVHESGHDLVIKVAMGRTGERRIAFGSTGLHLVRKSPAPVWLLPRASATPRRILAAVHPGRPGDDAKYALCQRIVGHALSLSRAFDAELHVVHVHEHPRPLSDTILGRKLTQYLALSEDQMIARVKRILSEADAEATLHTAHGAPEKVLPELTRSLEAHTLVMGSVGRTDVPGAFIGDLAEELLLRVDCGVFCVKPAGFASPIVPRVSARAS